MGATGLDGSAVVQTVQGSGRIDEDVPPEHSGRDIVSAQEER
jgi:hypothetical protein